ncbi:hypothetical protein [Polyangium spumosum]|uniref:HEAT repeat domain-containing protein n=1 Tax=Polyangium spumosum TaxID=889282 RepID=A0A6N7Q084_9BACT|nr:hypothetical protein [Polyangium spumosum]MRG94361.1 hypothetical protein [Polyangium spumosum]
MTTQARRLLLKDGVGTDVVRQFAAGQWFLWNRIEPLEHQPLVYEWATPASDCRIRYVDDHRLGLRWFDVEGPGAAATIELVRRSLPVYERAEIIALCSDAKTEAEGIWAAYKLAVTAEATFDAELFGCFGDLANHRDASVRRAAVYAMEQARWREFAGIAEPMAEDDPSEDVRARAAALVRALQ